jgi:glycerol-3-phosphate dehydrogenase (NAD(P)+)
MLMVAERYYATDCIHNNNEELKVDMPIADFEYKILYQGAPLNKELEQLSNTFK